MAKTTYREMPSKIANRQKFGGSSVWARTEGKYYVVYSYSTQIYKENLETGKKYFRNYFYSMTTTKIQSIIRRVMGIDDTKPMTKTVRLHEFFTNGSGGWHVTKEKPYRDYPYTIMPQ